MAKDFPVMGKVAVSQAEAKLMEERVIGEGQACSTQFTLSFPTSRTFATKVPIYQGILRVSIIAHALHIGMDSSLCR